MAQEPKPKSLDPLAEYLESRSSDGFRDTDIWTPQLRAAVKTYQWTLSGGEYKSWLDELADKVPVASREAQAEFIVTHHELWDVIYASRRAAVKAVPSLHELVQLLPESDEFAYEDIADWLNARVGYEQRLALLRHFKPDEPPIPPEADWWTFGFGSWLAIHASSLAAIAQAWAAITESAVGSVESTPSAQAVRAWAMEHGHKVGHRGRIPGSVVQEYLAEQQD